MPSAAIFAGGQATRFGGRDKSALLVEGRSILERQIDELARVADDILIVEATDDSRRLHDARKALDKTYGAQRFNRGRHGTRVQLRRVVDRVPSQGPLGALDAALAAARHDVVVVVACDMPFVTARFLNHLVALAASPGSTAATTSQDASGPDAVVPRTEDGYHPLCAVYKRACQPAVVRRLAEGRLSMSGVLDDVRVRVVHGEEIERFGDRARLLANVNTPSALDEIEAPKRHEAPS